MLTGLLDGSNWQQRHSLWSEYHSYVDKLADYIFTCGDYDIQTSLVETLYRFATRTDKTKVAATWFPNNAIVQSNFAKIKDFECDCRLFLNSLNKALGERQLVHSLPALSCHVGGRQFFKPPEQMYSQFWIDFNLGTSNIIIYGVKSTDRSALWDTVIVGPADVSAVSLVVSPAGESHLQLRLVQPSTSLFSSQSCPVSSSGDSHTVDIVFGLQPELRRLLLLMYPGKLQPQSQNHFSVASADCQNSKKV